MSDSILEIENLSFSYGRTHALNQLSLTIPRHRICAFVGSNGAGKTTTFSAIAGFIKPHRGSIRIDQQELEKYKKTGQFIGLLPQEVHFFQDRTVFSQLFLMAQLSGMSSSDAKKQLNFLFELTDLTSKRNSYPQELSRGMKVRLGIAQALLGNPPLILLDEPTAGLDPRHRNEFFNLIRTIAPSTTVVISSHQLHELEDICQHVVMIENGSLVFSESMDTLLGRSQTSHFFLNSLIDDLVPIQKELPGFCFEINPEKKSLKATLKQGQKYSLIEMNEMILTWLLKHKIGIIEIRQKSSLNDIYMKALNNKADNG